MNLNSQTIEAIKQLCSSNKVKSLFAFGSVTNKNFKENSDVDLLVDFDENDPVLYSDMYFNLKFKLEDLLNRKIDLLEERGLKNKTFKNHIDKSKNPDLWTLEFKFFLRISTRQFQK